ncbi:efflux RND transporter periplasmic adaptor subunit [Candidatus Uhrbacteria bacterium]|nr:efflux RND transporter periplasmic adaptor subunit [Candidatus Uhrbacteria bacterium]
MSIAALVKRKWLLALVLSVMAGGYFAYRSYATPPEQIRYVTVPVERGTLIVSVSGSGQVASSNQVDVKPKASGDAVSVPAVEGREVKAGALLVQLDARDAQKSVRDAEVSLETARLSLAKLKEPASDLDILQSENSLLQARESKQKAEDDLQKTFEDIYNDVADAFLDLPAIMTGLKDILYSNTAVPTQSNIDYYADTTFKYDARATTFSTDADSRYLTARAAYDANFTTYKNTGRMASEAELETLLGQTYETAKAVSEAVKSASNLIQFYKDTLTNYGSKPLPLADTHLAGLNGSTGKVNGHLSGLLATKNALKTDRDTIRGAERSIVERTASLADLKAGPSALDLRSQELTVKQREYALLDAREKLADYYVRAPFDGILAEVNIKKGESASSGAAVAVLLAKQKLAEISLNELDAAKVKVGQKSTLTFDAIEGLSISGEVAQIDAIGAVSQGVVNYGLMIAFDTQDARVKPGMSVTASIVTEMRPDVLMVPSTAVKYQAEQAAVEVMPAGAAAPTAKRVQTGLSNDTMTEIAGGLEEGELVVTQTVRQSAAPATTQQNNRSIFPTPTPSRGAGGGGNRGTFQIQR